ncbi:MAG: hypothetical protein QM758_09395 [Armatimonas sp.]
MHIRVLPNVQRSQVKPECAGLYQKVSQLPGLGDYGGMIAA